MEIHTFILALSLSWCISFHFKMDFNVNLFYKPSSFLFKKGIITCRRTVNLPWTKMNTAKIGGLKRCILLVSLEPDLCIMHILAHCLKTPPSPFLFFFLSNINSHKKTKKKYLFFSPYKKGISNWASIHQFYCWIF